MTTTFFTDPHLGLRRASHTTTASRERWMRRLYEQALLATRDADSAPAFCLGDLFDKYTNDETVILQGMTIQQRVLAIMAGNHDVVADAGKVGSLKLISELEQDVVIADFGDYGFETYQPEPGLRVYLVPHVTDQALFEQSLGAATDQAEEEDGVRILCLHCNYDSPFISGDTSLNLTRERAEQLLETFNYVLLGHEHVHRQDFGGRLIVIGSTFPTAFDNMGDKFRLVWNGEALVKELLWDSRRHYTWQVGEPCEPPEDVEFISITGTVSREQLAVSSSAIAGLWKAYPNLLGLRSMLEIEGEDAEVEVQEADLASLPVTIAEELRQKDPRMADLFNELLQEAEHV